MSTDRRITSIGGHFYYNIFLAGANKILENQRLLNAINVFPVPDADTGTNLAATLRAVIDQVKPSDSFKHTADAIAIAALNGARGNSGVIFAQFLYGVSNEAGEDHQVSIDRFADIVIRSVRYVYEAVAEPVEGTMLTVIRLWAEFIHARKETFDDFLKLMSSAFEFAQNALADTTQKLKALSLANVVDAGAKGFVLFLEGLLEGMTSKNKAGHLSLASLEVIPAINLPHDHITFRYCTEALLRAEQIDKIQLKKDIEGLGDSLVLAGSGRALRVHIHTDQPHILFEKLSAYGALSYQKADDMVRQNQVMTARKWNIALVTDSTCDLPAEILEHYQIHVVPLNIHFGESQYLDRLTIQPARFFDLIETEKSFPTTSQPNEQSFLNLYSHLASHYDSVIAVHLSGKFSGTLRNSISAAERISAELNRKISVLDSMHVSGSLGLQVLRIARAIEEGKDHSEIVSSFGEWRAKSKIYVSVKDLKNMVRGGRVSPMKGLIARLMNVKPIVSMDEQGGSALFDKAFSQKANMKKVMRHVEGFLKNGKVWNYLILHAEAEDTAGWFHREMTILTGKEPLAVVNISPVIGLSAGKGTAAVAIMSE